MREVRAGMMALPGPGHFAFPDVASYHMAQFAGVIATRREVGFWSGDLPLVMAIDGMTEAMAAKLGLRRRLRSGSSLQA